MLWPNVYSDLEKYKALWIIQEQMSTAGLEIRVSSTLIIQWHLHLFFYYLAPEDRDYVLFGHPFRAQISTPVMHNAPPQNILGLLIRQQATQKESNGRGFDQTWRLISLSTNAWAVSIQPQFVSHLLWGCAQRAKTKCCRLWCTEAQMLSLRKKTKQRKATLYPSLSDVQKLPLFSTAGKAGRRLCFNLNKFQFLFSTSDPILGDQDQLRCILCTNQSIFCVKHDKYHSFVNNNSYFSPFFILGRICRWTELLIQVFILHLRIVPDRFTPKTPASLLHQPATSATPTQTQLPAVPWRGYFTSRLFDGNLCLAPKKKKKKKLFYSRVTSWAFSFVPLWAGACSWCSINPLFATSNFRVGCVFQIKLFPVCHGDMLILELLTKSPASSPITWTCNYKLDHVISSLFNKN